MRGVIPDLRRPEIILRIIADFAVVQAAAASSLVSVLLWRLLDTPGIDGPRVTAAFLEIYRTRCLPFSLIFPIVFTLSGFYSYARRYSPSHKWRVIGSGSVAATLIYLFVDFVFTRVDILPRSSTVLFLCLVAVGTVGIRSVKSWLVDPPARAEVEVLRAGRTPEPILVVGGAGYIGTLLCRMLLEKGHHVRVLDSLIYGNGAIRGLLEHPRFELVTGDCRNIQSVVSAVKGVDAIVHLAAIVGDPACEQDRQTALEVNYAATRMLTEIARGNSVSRMVFASSCSVYGASEMVMNERSAVEPVSLYAQTKLDSERALLDACSGSFHPTVLRLATVFGYSARPRFDLVVNLLAAKAFQESVITIFNGQQWRPFIHVRDVARGIVRILDAPAAAVSGEIFNLGDSRLNYTLSAIAEHICVAFPSTCVECVENTDRRNYRVSFDKVRNHLGFECAVSLEEGIRELKAVFEQGLVTDYRAVEYHNQRFLQRVGRPANERLIDAQVMAAFAGAPLGEASPVMDLPLKATATAV
ncbi:MAG: NAD-dependent epimerase/dehydratase family protein [Bryobacteraceae bacterium]